ncbi:ribbon-helix-helix domain-containing protein [Tardiphaga robiniae]|uniref:Ribbon-helix-helix domain-containing protein n=1 Tax=Tardiphaga robiniae TaxID=943830 RepID=A0A7G6U163_9BRAD|nr:ribbon-helix-helix domain-containing protein [Tardiphaga robiniae]
MANLGKPIKPRKQTFTRTNGTSTSVSLEDAFWDALTEIASEEGISRLTLTRRIDRDRVRSNLTSAIRVSVVERFIAKYRSATGADADRQQKAGPGEGGLSR